MYHRFPSHRLTAMAVGDYVTVRCSCGWKVRSSKRVAFLTSRSHLESHPHVGPSEGRAA